MKRLLGLLREWWAGLREQVVLIAFTHAVLMLSKMAKPKLTALVAKLNQDTDRKFGDRAQVVQLQIADLAEILVTEFRVPRNP